VSTCIRLLHDVAATVEVARRVRRRRDVRLSIGDRPNGNCSGPMSSAPDIQHEEYKEYEEDVHAARGEMPGRHAAVECNRDAHGACADASALRGRERRPGALG
jgi:hypothetical protein